MLRPPRLVLASGNQGKLKEFRGAFQTLGVDLLSQHEFGISSVAETGTDFAENALIKARHAAKHSGLPALADDSGLVVAALGGAPGVHSARYAGDGADDEANMRKLLQQLQGVPPPQRGAYFHCCLVLLHSAEDSEPQYFSGRWSGSILERPQGRGGFGYDPVFWVAEAGCSAAELAPAEKLNLSHRGLAIRALLQAWAR